MLKTIAVAVLGSALIIGSGLNAGADEFKLIPSVAIRGEYNDNIFFDRDDAVNDYIGTASPGLEIINRTERLDLNLNGYYHIIRYKDTGDLDTEDYDGRGKISYQFTPRFSGSAAAAYIKDSRPDRDVVETGLVQNARIRRRQRYDGGLEYNISEKAAAAFSYLYQDDNWDSNDPRNEDLTLNSADMMFTYNLSSTFESTVGRLNFGYAKADYETSKTDYYFATLGFLHHFSEIYSLQLDAGPRYADLELENDQNDRGWGGRGSLSLIYSGEFTRADLSASHDIEAASGRRAPVERTSFVLNARHRFLEKLWLGLSTGYYMNESSSKEFAAFQVDERTVRVRPRFSWEIHRYVNIEGAYEYVYVNDNTDNANTDRNKVYLQVKFAYPVVE